MGDERLAGRIDWKLDPRTRSVSSTREAAGNSPSSLSNSPDYGNCVGNADGHGSSVAPGRWPLALFRGAVLIDARLIAGRARQTIRSISDRRKRVGSDLITGTR